MCVHGDCDDHKHYYPNNFIHKYSGDDQVRPLSILNNDTTSWVVGNPDPTKVITRKEALEIIINQATHRNFERKREMSKDWTNPANVGLFNDTNGHNAMVLCKLVDNVFIVWDSKF